MIDPPELRQVDDHIQAALDASCAALLALENARDETLQLGDDVATPYAAETQAIELIRSAIDELRRLDGSPSRSPLALGFVQGAPIATDVSPAPDDQSSSLRIA